MNPTTNPKILLFGKNGQVGYELQRTLASLGNVCAVGRTECDVADADAITATLDAVRPAVIVNAAAYTAVDKAESDRVPAHRINADAPGIMADWAAKNAALMVHFSTDYVFDGSKTTPWTEDDAPNPLNFYGKTKLDGDNNVRGSGCAHLIFRTSWVYGSRGKNFFLTMTRLLREKTELRVVNDQHGAPTWSRTIAEITAQTLSRLRSPLFSADLRALSGIYNQTNSGETTWFDFTNAIRDELLAAGGNATLAHVTPIRSDEYPTAAVRPKNSVLSGEKLRRAFGLAAPAWRDALRSVAACLRERRAQ